ncbi:MAG: hypothetical protein L0229_28120 [Blastocatellia bacterium]|nr:hypothetical protein [Blastocatellia bacterium]
MQPTDQEIARRMLEAIIERLDGGPHRATALDGEPPPPGREAPSPHGSNPALVLIVIGQLGTEFGTVERAGTQAVYEVAGKEAAYRNNDTQAHPGLEKFPLREGVKGLFLAEDAAAKRCFMEPDRVCVNSGACEMRGY